MCSWFLRFVRLFCVGAGDVLGLLGGSLVVISGVISRVPILITHIKGTYDPTYNYPKKKIPLKEAYL